MWLERLDQPEHTQFWMLLMHIHRQESVTEHILCLIGLELGGWEARLRRSKNVLELVKFQPDSSESIDDSGWAAVERGQDFLYHQDSKRMILKIKKSAPTLPLHLCSCLLEVKKQLVVGACTTGGFWLNWGRSSNLKSKNRKATNTTPAES